MAERSTRPRLDVPVGDRRPRRRFDPEAFGRLSEQTARFLGTARFIVYLTVFVVVWLVWNTFLPASIQFDPAGMNYTLLTLILSLQASYAAPLILLAQNRQADRDRVSMEEDRAAYARTMADTEYLIREVAALRVALGEVATRDFLRSELRDLAEEVATRAEQGAGTALSAVQERQQREDERERRRRKAERKKAQRAATGEPRDEHPTSSLSEPFLGEHEDG